MPHLTTDDGVKLYYEETGKGIPIVFIHEFAGDFRSWEQQVRHFAKYYRCITFNARGYPPSDVPKDQEKYSQERARDDIRAVLDALKIDKAHIVGLSMGGFAALHFGFTYGNRARSIVVAGCGYGAAPGERAKFAEEAEASAKRFEELTMKKAAEGYALGPTRVQHQNKDPRGWREFADQLAEHSTEGAALTMRGVQKRRPSLFDLVEKMKTITVPTLIMTGDEDWPCLEPGILMKKNIPTASLVVMGNSGHNINLEEPAIFNMHLSDLFQAADAGHMAEARSARAMAGTILGALRSGLRRVVAAVDQEVGAGHEARRVAGKKDRGLRDFLGLAEPLQQMLRAGRSSRGFHVAEALHQAIGLDRARRQRVHPDVLRGMVGRHRLGELDQCALAGAVDRAARSRDAAELRSDVDDAAAARLDHRRQDRAAHQERAGDIDAEHLVPVGERELQHRAVRIVSGRAVQQNVDGGIFGEDRFGGCLDLRLVAHVAGNRDRRLPDRRGRCLCRRSCPDRRRRRSRRPPRKRAQSRVRCRCRRR